jgi:hypothetical protein
MRAAWCALAASIRQYDATGATVTFTRSAGVSLEDQGRCGHGACHRQHGSGWSGQSMCTACIHKAAWHWH